jgi:PPOX class probable F420-dependent enzyme
MDLRMTPDEREAFLAQPHVGVLAVEDDNGAPVVTPVWYRYRPGGDVVFNTSSASTKARLLRQRGVATFCVQEETPPQRYVSVTGPVELMPATEDERREIAARYLPADAIDAFVGSGDSAAMVIVRLRPTRWRSTDFGKLPAG